MTVPNRMDFAEPADCIAAACSLLDTGEVAAARELVAAHYPLDPHSPTLEYPGPRSVPPPVAGATPKRRTPGERVRAVVFARDGYVDRYTGRRLVSPAVLRYLGDGPEAVLHDVLPYHVNGGRGAPAVSGARATCHQAGFELYASLEHIVPCSRGGDDGDDEELANFLTTTPDLNYEKSDETWLPLHPPGDLREWDGLASWFLAASENDDRRWVPRWRRASAAAVTDPRVVSVQADPDAWHRRQLEQAANL